MTIKYYPKVDKNYSQIVGQEVAFAVLLPDAYNTSKKWKWGMAVHGQGELSPGAEANLRNLVEGFDYNNDGIREGAAFVTDGMKWAVDAHQLIMVIPTYNDFLDPEEVDKVYDFMLANYSVQGTFMLTGFSLGGGCVFKYASSSEMRAKRVHLAVPCAGIYSLVNASIAAKNGTVWHAFSNDNDNRVGVSNTISQVDKINGQVPAVKALYTVFRRDGHGSNIEAWDKVPPKAPGGQGFTDAAETIYQLNDAILAGVPRQMKSGTVIPSPEPTPVPTTKAIVKFTLTGPNLKLDGSGSTGWTNGYDGVWNYDGGPLQYSWDVFPGGSSWIVADAVLKKPGTYKFSFKLKGDPEIKTVTIDFGKVPVSFDSESDLITYSDGTTEKGIVVFSGGKWVLKDSKGQILNL